MFDNIVMWIENHGSVKNVLYIAFALLVLSCGGSVVMAIFDCGRELGRAIAQLIWH